MPKAVVLTKFGPPDVLVWRDVPMPEPGPGQVRIRVKAAGVMPTDVEIRRGDLEAVFPLPPDAVLGFEAAGVVDALGPSVSGVKEGDEVASLLAGASPAASPSRPGTSNDHNLAARLAEQLAQRTFPPARRSHFRRPSQVGTDNRAESLPRSFTTADIDSAGWCV